MITDALLRVLKAAAILICAPFVLVFVVIVVLGGWDPNDISDWLDKKMK